MFPQACPLPAALVTLLQSTCGLRLDQVIRLLFQQRQTTPSFSDETDFKTLATWQGLIGAADATKVTVSPIFSSFVIPQSEPLTTGGNDNSTVGGIPEYNGEGIVTPTGQYKNITAQQKEALMTLTQFSVSNTIGYSNLTAYFVTKDGRIGYLDTFIGMEVYNYRVGSRGSEGLNAPDIVPFGFTLPQDWDTKFRIIKPNFNPLTELV